MANKPSDGLSWASLPEELLEAADMLFSSQADIPRPPDFEVAKLKAFARKRGLPIGPAGWEMAVIYQAAIEHVELREGARGRPSNRRTFGLLGPYKKPPAQVEEDRVLDLIEGYQKVLSKMGKKSSSAAAARELVRRLDGHDPDNPNEDAKFRSKLQVRQNQASRARSRRTQSLKP